MLVSKTTVFVIALLIGQLAIAVEEAYCTRYAKKGVDLPQKRIEEICEKGDVLLVDDIMIVQYCDFSKQIISAPNNDRFYCQYVGYPRKFRSRATGELVPLLIDE